MIFKLWMPPTFNYFYLFGFSKLVAYKLGLINLRKGNFIKSTGSLLIDEEML